MRASSIANLFGRSPFGPTQELMRKAVECAGLLRPLFEVVVADDRDAIEAVTEQINRVETEADEIKNGLRDNLPRSLFLAVDRRDLLELVHMQDSIADSTQEAADLLALKRLSLPETLKPSVVKFVNDVIATCESALAIVEEMDDLVESAFNGPEAERVLEMIQELDANEEKSDALEVRLAKELFTLEDEISAVDLMLWRELIRTVGDVANNAERTANRLRLLIARS